MTVVQAGFSPGGNCDGENTAQVQTLVRLGNTPRIFRIFKDETMDNKLMYFIKVIEKFNHRVYRNKSLQVEMVL